MWLSSLCPGVVLFLFFLNCLRIYEDLIIAWIFNYNHILQTLSEEEWCNLWAQFVEYIEQLKKWCDHLDFAFEERNFYQANSLLAKKDNQKLNEMILDLGENWKEKLEEWRRKSKESDEEMICEEDVNIEEDDIILEEEDEMSIEREGEREVSHLNYCLELHLDLFLKNVWIHISVDAIWVLPFPYVGFEPQAHSTYFLNKMKVYVMGVVNEGTNFGMGYIWDSTRGPTKSNHILSSIFYFIQQFSQGERNLWITMDNCGVNKLYLICGVAVAMVILELFDEVNLDWLVVEHTKFASYWMFGTFSKLLHHSNYYSETNVSQNINKKTSSSLKSTLLPFVLNFSKIIVVRFFLGWEKIKYEKCVRVCV